MIPCFPKIFAIGSKQTQGLFDGEIEITEKVDGSMIGFGNINGELIIRSKGQRIYPETVDKMFKAGVEVIQNLFNERMLREGFIFYGEYLRANKHNVLVYDRAPRDHIALFGVLGHQGVFEPYNGINAFADIMGLDVVPLLYKGHYPLQKDGENSLIADLMKKESFLGKSKIEGIVIKNYAKDLLIGNQVIPILMGKYVSEEFKEVHNKNWKSENTGKGKWEVYKSQFCNTARWHKAIHFLRDAQQLEYDPRDIGKLLRRINEDIEEEEKENIKEWLWNNYGKEVLREAGKGFPMFYKNYLLQKGLESKTEEG